MPHHPNIQSRPFFEAKPSDLELQNLLDISKRVLSSGKYILGEEVSAFEKRCSDYLSIKNTTGVSSGTDALTLALLALDIGPGDEVICPAFSFVASASCIVRVGAIPVFCDVDPVYFTLDLNHLRSLTTENTKAIIVVHLFGQMEDMNQITSIAKKKDIPIVEDAAQAFGSQLSAENTQKHAGTFGTFGCFSFFPTKNLGGFGDGGLVVSNNQALLERIISLRQHGRRSRDIFETVGGNFRLDALQAALLSYKLNMVEEERAIRNRYADIYTHCLAPFSDEIQLPAIRDNSKHSFNQYIVRIKNGKRDELRSALASTGTPTMIYYKNTLPDQPCFANLKRMRKTLVPNCHAVCNDVLALPICAKLPESDIKHHAGNLKRHISTKTRS